VVAGIWINVIRVAVARVVAAGRANAASLAGDVRIRSGSRARRHHMQVLDRLRPQSTVVGIVALAAALAVAPATASAAPAGRVLGYVANNGGGVSVIDTATNAVSTTITDSGGSSPYTVDVAFDGTRGYVTNIRDNTLTVIDAPTNTIDATVSVGARPAGVVVAPDGGHVYVTNYVDGTVSVVDVATFTVAATIPVGPNPDGVAITPNGESVYVAHDVAGPGTVSVIDTATNAVVADIATGSTPTAVDVTPDGTRLVVVNKASGNVAVVDTATNTVLGTVGVGFTPHGVVISPDGVRAYVTNSDSDSVSVVDIVARTVLGSMPVGDRPIGVALTPDGAKAYVTNFTDGTVSVVDTASLTVTATVAVGTQPVGVAVHRVPPAGSGLKAGSATLTPRILGFTVRGLDAKLTQTRTGVPVAGRRIVFRTVGGQALCGANTDATGVAKCDATVFLLVGTSVLLQGYTASFAGDDELAASASHGVITLL
jgi:YVTN family beta-propeller protein